MRGSEATRRTPADRRLRLARHNAREATAALAPVRDDASPAVRLASAVTALLQAVAQGEPGDLVSEVADLLREVSVPAVLPGARTWPVQPLTQGETRVLRYLATHLSAREIAAELCVSANTVRTHLRHLYWKLGAHSRREAVYRARAIGLLAASSRGPWTPTGDTSWPTDTPNGTSPSSASSKPRRDSCSRA